MSNKIELDQLPVAEFEKIGLYKDGKLMLGQDNIDALLAGRRTDFITLKNVGNDSYNIEQIDVKVSMKKDESGRLNLKLHPIHKVAKDLDILTKQEADLLKTGKLDNVERIVTNEKGDKESIIIEYDNETREYLTINANKVKAPEAVNGEPLTAEQQEKFKKGKQIELSDGTQLRMSAKEKNGVLSNSAALMLSLMLDGGISYLIVKGLRNFENKQNTSYSKGYEEAVKEMQLKKSEQQKEKISHIPKLTR